MRVWGYRERFLSLGRFTALPSNPASLTLERGLPPWWLLWKPRHSLFVLATWSMHAKAATFHDLSRPLSVLWENPWLLPGLPVLRHM